MLGEKKGERRDWEGQSVPLEEGGEQIGYGEA